MFIGFSLHKKSIKEALNIDDHQSLKRRANMIRCKLNKKVETV